MKIEVLVYDASCMDAGKYFCNASYVDVKQVSSLAVSYQDLIVRGELDIFRR